MSMPLSPSLCCKERWVKFTCYNRYITIEASNRAITHKSSLVLQVDLQTYLYMVPLHTQDADVLEERKRVLSGATTENEVVIIKNLVKVCACEVVYPPVSFPHPI